MLNSSLRKQEENLKCGNMSAICTSGFVQCQKFVCIRNFSNNSVKNTNSLDIQEEAVEGSAFIERSFDCPNYFLTQVLLISKPKMMVMINCLPLPESFNIPIY